MAKCEKNCIKKIGSDCGMGLTVDSDACVKERKIIPISQVMSNGYGKTEIRVIKSN